jgi:hypothetical protein
MINFLPLNYIKGLAKPKPTEFIKKNTGKMGSNALPEGKLN